MLIHLTMRPIRQSASRPAAGLKSLAINMESWAGYMSDIFRRSVLILFSLLLASCSSIPDIKRDAKYQTPSAVDGKARLVVFWPQPPSERTTTDAVKVIIDSKNTVILGTKTYALLMS